MKLFDKIKRTHKTKRTYNESIFEYLNISARSAIERIRNIIEDWFTRYPNDQHKEEFKTRFRSKDDYVHLAAFFELFNHELFLKTGFNLEIHPKLLNSEKHPDFLASKEDVEDFYIEATICTPSLVEISALKLLSETINKIDNINCPNFQFYMRYENPPSNPIPQKTLEKAILSQLSQFDPKSVKGIADLSENDKAPLINLNINNFKFSLELFSRKSKHNIGDKLRNVFMRMGPAYKIDADQALRSTITRKANKYKNLDKPLLLSINYIDEKIIELDDIDISNALFGSEQVILTLDEKHQITGTELSRKLNGALFTNQGPTYQRISAVMFASNVKSSDFESRTPEIWHLPYPNYRLDYNLFTLPQLIPNHVEHQMEKKHGEKINEILNSK